jgi:hypothetical protein
LEARSQADGAFKNTQTMETKNIRYNCTLLDGFRAFVAKVAYVSEVPVVEQLSGETVHDHIYDVLQLTCNGATIPGFYSYLETQNPNNNERKDMGSLSQV